jgi:HSP20 family protein
MKDDMMRRPSPFADLESWFDRMNEQVEQLGRFDGNWMRSSDFAIDVAEHDADVVVTADLPGFEKSDIDVSVSERTLTIRADRDVDAAHEAGSYLRRERRHTSVRRSVPLPAHVVEDDATASYKNGVLTVTLPRRHVVDEDSRHIDVE